MISTKPYFLRAIREWALDNNLTPQMLVDASHDNVVVPDIYVNNSQILLNISDQAVNGLVLGNEEIVFSARFNGKPWQISVPIEAVMAIFTREDGQGIFFESTNTIVSAGVKVDPDQTQPQRPGSGATAKIGLASSGPVSPNVAKGAQSDNDSASWVGSKTPEAEEKVDRDKQSSSKNEDDPDPDDTSPGRRGRPNLRLVD